MASTGAAARRVCSVCCQQAAQYTCPRCHKAYCTSACYKQHSHTCTEAFYREQATSQMKATRSDAQQAQQMMQILQRMHQQGHNLHGDPAGSSDSSSDEEEEAAGFDAGLDRSPALQALLERAVQQGDDFDVQASELTPELLAELERLAVTGQLSHLVPPWQPWWTLPAAGELQLNAAGQRVVQVMQELHSTAAGAAGQPVLAAAAAPTTGQSEGVQLVAVDADGAAVLPAPPSEPLPSLGVLTGPGFRPSPLLPWQLLQLLVAYCAIMRWHNGEPDTSSCSSSSSDQAGDWEAAEQLLLLAPPLSQLLVAAAASTAQGQQQQDQQPEPAAAASVVPDSVRCACMQLAAAAAQLHSGTGLSGAAHFSLEVQQQAAGSSLFGSAGAGGAVPAEMRALLQVASGDALTLLQLGRPAVVLALTDSWRMVEQGRQNIKLQKQQQQLAASSSTLQSAGISSSKRSSSSSSRLAAGHTAAGKGSSAPSSKQSRQQLKQLEQYLKLAARKLHFYMVWSNEQPASMYEGLALQLAQELQEQQDMARPAAEVDVHLNCEPEMPKLSTTAAPVFPAAKVTLQQQQQQQQHHRTAMPLLQPAAPSARQGSRSLVQQQQPAEGQPTSSLGLYQLD